MEHSGCFEPGRHRERSVVLGGDSVVVLAMKQLGLFVPGKHLPISVESCLPVFDPSGKHLGSVEPGVQSSSSGRHLGSVEFGKHTGVGFVV